MAANEIKLTVESLTPFSPGCTISSILKPTHSFYPVKNTSSPAVPSATPSSHALQSSNYHSSTPQHLLFRQINAVFIPANEQLRRRECLIKEPRISYPSRTHADPTHNRLKRQVIFTQLLPFIQSAHSYTQNLIHLVPLFRRLQVLFKVKYHRCGDV